MKDEFMINSDQGPSHLSRLRVRRIRIHSTILMSTAVTPSDSATTDMAPHFVLVTRVIPMDAGLGFGRQDKRHGEAKDV